MREALINSKSKFHGLYTLRKKEHTYLLKCVPSRLPKFRVHLNPQEGKRSRAEGQITVDDEKKGTVAGWEAACGKAYAARFWMMDVS